MKINRDLPSGRGVLDILGKALAVLVVQSFAFGTIFWAAVDIFALYTENQFTGRMRAFDVEYWSAVRGAAFVIGTAVIANIIGNRLIELVIGKTEESE